MELRKFINLFDYREQNHIKKLDEFNRMDATCQTTDYDRSMFKAPDLMKFMLARMELTSQYEFPDINDHDMENHIRDKVVTDIYRYFYQDTLDFLDHLMAELWSGKDRTEIGEIIQTQIRRMRDPNNID